MTPRDRTLLEDMLENARIAVEVLEARTEAEAKEIVPFYALVHAVQIVGEAAAKLDAGLKAREAGVPWREIVDTRNLIVHAYHRVAPEIVFGIVRSDLPRLIQTVERVLAEDPE